MGVNKILGVLRTDVNTLKTTVGDAGSGLVKAVSDNATNIRKNADEIGKINDASTGILATAKKYTDDELTTLKGGYTGDLQTLRSDINSNDTDIAHLQELHATGSHNGYSTVAEEINAKAGADITGTVQKYVEDKVSTIKGTTDGLNTRIAALEGTVGDAESGLVKDVTDNKAKLATLIGSDASKSVRTIANEELAAQLIPANAAESLNTLQEIAAWIQAHPGDASEMNAKITALEGTVGKEAEGDSPATGLVKKVADNASNIKANSDKIGTNATNIKANADAIDALEALHAKDGQTMKSVATEVSEGITGIAEHSETNDVKETKTADVVVTVTTKSGSVSAVAVDAGVLDGKVTAEVTRAKEAESGLRTDLGEKGDASTKATAFGRIKALEEAQSSGSLMWSDWQN